MTARAGSGDRATRGGAVGGRTGQGCNHGAVVVARVVVIVASSMGGGGSSNHQGAVLLGLIGLL